MVLVREDDLLIATDMKKTNCNNGLCRSNRYSYVMSSKWIVSTLKPHTQTHTPKGTVLSLVLSLFTLPCLLSPSLFQLYHDSAAQPLQHDSTLLTAPQSASTAFP